MEDSSSIGSGGPGADTSPGRENAPGSAGTKAPPLPVLELDDGTEIFYGMEKSVLEEKQPDLENTFGPVYKLESGSLVGVYIREDEETGSETVAGWNTASSGTGPAGGLQVGDSYEKYWKLTRAYYPLKKKTRKLPAGKRIHMIRRRTKAPTIPFIWTKPEKFTPIRSITNRFRKDCSTGRWTVLSGLCWISGWKAAA